MPIAGWTSFWVGLGLVVAGCCFARVDIWAKLHPEAGIWTRGGTGVFYGPAAIFLVNAFFPLHRREDYVAIFLAVLTLPYLVNHLSDEATSAKVLMLLPSLGLIWAVWDLTQMILPLVRQ